MKRIGITGQAGFIGTHLSNNIHLYPDKYTIVDFEDKYFEDEIKLDNFVRSCDFIVHLAALNRHNDPDAIFSTNINLVQLLIKACTRTGSHPHIMFSSSTQEQLENPYGRSKREGRLMLEDWASMTNSSFTGFVIPNVFGPFGNPFYNSVVSTFCHQVVHNEQPKIIVDSEVRLIYVDELISIILEHIDNEPAKAGVSKIDVMNTCAMNVSGLLAKIRHFDEQYIKKGIIPDLGNSFDRNLFNTFYSYVDHGTRFPCPMGVKTDERGFFVETMKTSSAGQTSFSTTRPGITRGNHYHTRKFERFAVIKGNARIEIRRIGTDKKFVFELDGNRPSFVDMPVWYTHNITNTGKDDLYTLFWISEHFDPSNPDTYFEKV